MHTVHISSAGSNNPLTLQSWSVGLPDDPCAEMIHAEADRAAIEAERIEELADLARIEAEDHAQRIDATDLDFVDYIGTGKIHMLIDAFERRDVKALKSELSRLTAERSTYRRLFNARQFA